MHSNQSPSPILHVESLKIAAMGFTSYNFTYEERQRINDEYAIVIH